MFCNAAFVSYFQQYVKAALAAEEMTGAGQTPSVQLETWFRPQSLSLHKRLFKWTGVQFSTKAPTITFIQRDTFSERLKAMILIYLCNFI